MLEKVAIIGQGYVGLPLAIAAAESGYEVIGIDNDEKRVERLNQGRSDIEDISSHRLEKVIHSGNYRVVNDLKLVSRVSIILICVPTPLDSVHKPDLSILINVTKEISKYLKKNSLIILESTVGPGTTRTTVLPLIEKISGLNTIEFDLVFSPERIDPTNKKWGIANTPKLVSGLSDKGLKRAVKFYSKFISQLIECESFEVAETAKLLENSFRLINISFINEIAKFCHAMNINVNDVIKAASTKPYGFMTFFPGVGIGGHCIPVDPVYLAAKAREIGVSSDFIDLANQHNSGLPRYFSDLAEKKIGNLRNRDILIIGVAYKPNVSDTRETPVGALINELESKGARVSWHDDLVKTWRNQRSVPLGENFDLAILAVLHDYIDLTKIGQTALLDTRGIIE